MIQWQLGQRSNNKSSKHSTIRTPASNNISVPTEIICCRCLVVKNKAAFSENRLRELVEYMVEQTRNGRFNAKVTRYIPCSSCSGQNRTELQCHMCDIWKGIDSFSKAQRKLGDEAICVKCAEKRDEEDSDSDGSNPYHSGDDDDETDIYTTSDQTSTRASTGGIRVPSSGATIYAGRGDTTTNSTSAQSAPSTIDDEW